MDIRTLLFGEVTKATCERLGSRKSTNVHADFRTLSDDVRTSSRRCQHERLGSEKSMNVRADIRTLPRTEPRGVCTPRFVDVYEGELLR